MWEVFEEEEGLTYNVLRQNLIQNRSIDSSSRGCNEVGIYSTELSGRLTRHKLGTQMVVDTITFGIQV